MTQKVALGTTKSGVPGFFTKRMLAFALQQAQYEDALANRRYAEALARRFHFEYVATDAETFD